MGTHGGAWRCPRSSVRPPPLGRVEDMFTGLIADLGSVAAIGQDGEGATLRIGTSLAGELAEGDSIAVSGVCLTATRVGGGGVRGPGDPRDACPYHARRARPRRRGQSGARAARRRASRGPHRAGPRGRRGNRRARCARRAFPGCWRSTPTPRCSPRRREGLGRDRRGLAHGQRAARVGLRGLADPGDAAVAPRLVALLPAPASTLRPTSSPSTSSACWVPAPRTAEPRRRAGLRHPLREDFAVRG